MDVRKLLKVYNVVNDEKRHKYNLKFAGALVAFLASGIALVAFAALEGNGGAPGAGQDTLASTDQGPNQTECISLDPDAIGAGQVPSTAVEDLYNRWALAHPDAEIVSVAPMFVGEVHVGYCITTQPS